MTTGICLTHKKMSITAPLHYGGESANIYNCAMNEQYAFNQVSAFNQPQRKASNRYQQLKLIKEKLSQKPISFPITLFKNQKD